MEKQMWYFRLAGRNKEYNVTNNADKAAFLRTLPQWEEITEEEYARYQMWQNEAWQQLASFADEVQADTAAPPAPAHTVQCRCGYMASEHDAEGNCPGDGYELSRMQQPPAPGDSGDEWQSAGAYSHQKGAIQWENGYAAIEQLAFSCVGSKDTRFLQETMNAIYAIAVTERELAAKQADVRAPGAGAAEGGG